MKIEEVNHFSISKSIHQISNGSAKHQGEGKSQGLFVFQFKEKVEENAYCKKRKRDKKERAGPGLLCSEESKGASWISHMSEIEEMRNDFYRLPVQEPLFHFIFRPLIENNNHQKGKQKNLKLPFHLFKEISIQ